MNKEALLKKFLNNDCTIHESEIVMQLLNDDPALLDDILDKNEWDAIQESPKIPAHTDAEIRKEIFTKTNRPVYRLSPLLVAATLVSLLLIGIVLLKVTDHKNAGVEQMATHIEHRPASEIIENKSTAVKTIHLADRSTIELYPGSSVEYEVNFVANRAVTLKGKAIFTVVKNTASPFVVQSGDISTMALGTRFLVDNSYDISKVNVQLFEGKVVVQALDATLSIAATYLDAGQQCFIDLSTSLVQVKPIESLLIAHAGNKNSKPVKINSSILQPTQIIFSKTSMPEVLEKLQTVYGTPISFDRDDIGEIFFTGSFTSGDSLCTIIGVIAAMNDLTFSKEENNIRVIRNELPVANTRDKSESAIIHEPVISAVENIEKTAPAEAPALPAENAAPQIVQQNEAIQYNAISLSALMESLQKKTKRTIEFNTSDLENINFTGTLPDHLSIRQVLSTICKLNGLTLEVKKQTYYISKAKK